MSTKLGADPDALRFVWGPRSLERIGPLITNASEVVGIGVGIGTTPT